MRKALFAVLLLAPAASAGDLISVSHNPAAAVNGQAIAPASVTSPLILGATVTVNTTGLVTSAGKVGIGIASPSSVLDVYGIISSTVAYELGNNTYQRLATGDQNGGFGGGYNLLWKFSTSSPVHAVTAAVAGMAYDNSGTLWFYTNTSASAGTVPPTRMTITPAGSVGVGTTAPASKFHVSSGTITDDGTGAGVKGPAISTVTSCGNTVTFVGNAFAGKITVGSSPSTTCSITWASAYTNGSSCWFSEGSRATLTTNEVVSDVQSSTVTFSGSITGGDTINYLCNGF